ncbi:hypothetical protein [Dactylococcopsis salina]|uniref:Uncharacterized protein n=1 Tax=Dactylococcopsis salina (strain PCC 8305) TaxID=13035 RepID=K9YUM7_DACS8|nr:hypothetical protein [Dactylococcopsis salina]AFZ49808.1 hypothetical protein Dacsa_1103 [Dactylococcopsis salina PCC 8305]
MKFNSTLAFILIFVVVMIGSGVISGLKGYTAGDEALKNVSQPDVKVRNNQGLANPDQSSDNGNITISEAEVLKQVNAIMNRKQEKAIPLDGSKAPKNQDNNDDDSFIQSP